MSAQTDTRNITVGELELLFDSSPDEEVSKRRVLVEAYLPHVSSYGHNPMMSLVYGWPGGPLKVGDIVLCPPTPRRHQPFEAIVISLDASQCAYKGPVKYIIKRVR